MITDDQLKDNLIAAGLITEKQYERAKKLAKARGKTVPEILVEENIISDEHLGEIMANLLGFPYVNLRKEPIPLDILRIVPEIVARKHGLIAFSLDKFGLKLAMVDPKNLEMIRLIQKKQGVNVVPYFATPRDVEEALRRYRKEIKEEFKEIIASEAAKLKGKEIEEILEEARMPVVKIVDTILSHAYENRASDVHIEPREKEILLRFRIDGILHDVVSLPLEIHPLLVSRIKILASLKTDEHFAAQDGKFRLTLNKEQVDVRVSVVPIVFGEKVVMRVLSEKLRKFSLEELGFLKKDLTKIKEAMKEPWGMILATGPTGCGKTTTLYAILKILNTPDKNIQTIEDPVEYSIEGINQIQVNPQTGLSFAKGLKSIIRQDPDIIMVGEIRDNETAGIAINAAMTGHLVLSTLHTNDAATSLPRLLDMEIEPFLIASTINVIIAQRLVRKICPKCIASLLLEKNDLEKLLAALPSKSRVTEVIKRKKVRVYKGKGCKKCNHTGYLGRVGIFEVMEMSEGIKKLIMARADADAVQKKATELSMTTMLEDGLEKAFLGITSIEEVLRVIRE